MDRVRTCVLLAAGLVFVWAGSVSAQGVGSIYRLKLMLDGFNVFNQNTILNYASGNINRSGYTQPTSILPPRVFRAGASITF